MSERVLLYARVSSEGQSETGKESLPYQLERCREYADRIGWHVIGEYSDTVPGSEEVLKRPGFLDLFDALEETQASRLVVLSVDRLARDSHIASACIRLLEDRGCTVSIVEGRLDSSTPEGNLILKILSAFSEHENLLRGLRSRIGKRTRARSGLTFTGARPPFGYVEQNGSLEIVPEEAEVVERIFSLYANGESMRGVVRKLEGIPTPADRRHGDDDYAAIHKKQDRGRWAVSTIRNILDNRTYIGTWTYKPSGDQKPIGVPAPAIIAPELYEAAQETRKNKRWKKKERKDKLRFLFRYRVTCADCGRARYPVPEYPSRPKAYFECDGRHAAHEEDRCRSLNVPARHLEGEVATWLIDFISQPDEIERLIADLEANPETREVRRLKHRLEDLDHRIEEDEGALDRLLSDFVSGAWSEEKVAEKKNETEERKARLEQQRQEIRTKLAAEHMDPAEIRRAWEHTLQRMQSYLDPEGWRAFAEEAQERPEPGDLAAWAEWTEDADEVLKSVIEELDVQITVGRDPETKEVHGAVSCVLLEEPRPLAADDRPLKA